MSELRPIAELPDDNGPTPDDVVLTDREELVLELVEVGVALRKAESLVARFPKESIQRQLGWLSQRSPRRSAPLLIAAIEQNYGPPAYGDDA